MVGFKVDLEMVSSFACDFMCTFLYALKFIFSAFIDDLKWPLIYRLKVV